MLLIGSSLHPILTATSTTVAHFIGGFLTLGVSLESASLVLIVIVMGSFGIVSARFTIVFEKADLFTASMLVAPGLLSGTVTRKASP